MSSNRCLMAVVSFVAGSACGPSTPSTPSTPGGTTSGTTGAGSSGPVDGVTTSQTQGGGFDDDAGGDSPSGGLDDGVGDDGPPPLPDTCSIWLQDCPEGEKCTVFNNDGGTAWNGNRCVPIAESPAGLEEPCTIEGEPASGLDDCDAGLLCVYDDLVAQTGFCRALCTGSADAPQCNGDEVCIIRNGGALALCERYCDPLLQDCPGGTCALYFGEFLCEPFVIEGPAAAGEVCLSEGDCIETTTCTLAAQVPGCSDSRCCTSYCDTSVPDPGAACLPGQACVQWYPLGEAPAGFAHVGLCGAG